MNTQWFLPHFTVTSSMRYLLAVVCAYSAMSVNSLPTRTQTWQTQRHLSNDVYFRKTPSHCQTYTVNPKAMASSRWREGSTVVSSSRVMETSSCMLETPYSEAYTQ